VTASALAQAVIRELQRRADPATQSTAWPGVVAAICTNPRPFAQALGLLMDAPRIGRTFH
jgi:hypothetical protein